MMWQVEMRLHDSRYDCVHYLRKTGCLNSVDWSGALDHWTGLLDYWTGLLNWNTGLTWTTCTHVYTYQPWAYFTVTEIMVGNLRWPDSFQVSSFKSSCATYFGGGFSYIGTPIAVMKQSEHIKGTQYSREFLRGGCFVFVLFCFVLFCFVFVVFFVLYIKKEKQIAISRHQRSSIYVNTSLVVQEEKTKQQNMKHCTT